MDTSVYFVILQTDETFEEVVRLGKKRYRQHLGKYPNYCLYNAKDIPNRFLGICFEMNNRLPKGQFNFTFKYLEDR